MHFSMLVPVALVLPTLALANEGTIHFGELSPVSVVASPQVSFHTPAILRIAKDDTQLHRLALRHGISTTFSFRGTERIEGVIVGNPDSYLVETLGSRQTVAIQPDSGATESNLTITTNEGVYHFHVAPTYGVESTNYGVVIENISPDRARANNAEVDPSDLNLEYTFAGTELLRPTSTFDDGVRTYFAFPDHIALPAIFAVDANGKEAVVNYHKRGKYIVVEMIERQFTLREGDLATCIFNKDYPVPVYGPEAPQPEGGASALFSVSFDLDLLPVFDRSNEAETSWIAEMTR